jgi:hypothetical protein
MVKEFSVFSVQFFFGPLALVCPYSLKKLLKMDILNYRGANLTDRFPLFREGVQDVYPTFYLSSEGS